MNLFNKKGYKETDAGWIPFGWQARRIGEMTDVSAGGTPITSIEDYWSPPEVPWMSSGEVRARRIHTTEKKISKLGLKNSAAKIFPKKSIVMALAGQGKTRGCVAVLESEVATNQSLAAIYPSTHFETDFLFHNLDWRYKELRSLSSGEGGRGGLNLSIIKSIPIGLPPLPEQQKIAAILTAVDDKLDIIARQIKATQTLKRGLMQTLFSRGVGTQDAAGRWVPHSEFKDSELGKIPVGWEVGTIGSYVAALRSGVSVNAEDRIHSDNEVGVLKVSCVFNGRFHPDEHKTVLLEEEGRVGEPVEQGRIIISRANTPALVGESAYVDSSRADLFLPDKLWQTQPSDKTHSVKWLAFFLQSPFARQEISKAATGTSGSMKNISKPAFLSIPMPLVPISEQGMVADVLTTITSKLEALVVKQAQYQSLKRGLMQKLLTGDWRVKLDTEAVAA